MESTTKQIYKCNGYHANLHDVKAGYQEKSDELTHLSFYFSFGQVPAIIFLWILLTCLCAL